MADPQLQETSARVDALPLEQWRRLHPLSPLVRLGGIALFFLFVVTSQLATPPARQGARAAQNFGFFVNGGLYALFVTTILIGGVISWIVTRWRIHDGNLQVEMGLIRRQSFRIPLDRIQAIDVVAPLTARLIGLAEVRVVSAGRGLERGRLAYMRTPAAYAVRAQLLALAHGLDVTTPAPPARYLAQVDNARLIAGVVLRAPVILLGVLDLGLIVIATMSPRPQEVIGASVTALITLGVHAFRHVNDTWSTTIGDSQDGLRLDRGLLQTRHETIPYGRIQGVRLVEPLLWRAFGWVRVEVDVARQGVARTGDANAGRVARMLMPIAPRAEALWLLQLVLPGAPVAVPADAQPPRRAWWLTPLSFHFLASWRDAQYAAARTGRVCAMTVIVPLWKVQSARVAQGPLQRFLRLASVHIDTAGHRWTAPSPCRDATEAYAIVDDIAASARTARSNAAAAGLVGH